MIEDLTAIRSYFLDSLSTIGVDEDQVVMDNQPPRDVDEKRIWIRFQIRPGDTREEQIGGNRILVTQIGNAILQVFAPAGEGPMDAFTIAQNFNEAFRKWKSVSPTGYIRGYPYGYRAIPVQADDKLATTFQVNATVYYESLRRKPR